MMAMWAPRKSTGSERPHAESKSRYGEHGCDKSHSRFKRGRIEYRLDKTNIIHCPPRQSLLRSEKLSDNFGALLGAIVKAKPAAAKGQYIRSCVVASTMGPGVKINPSKVAE